MLASLYGPTTGELIAMAVVGIDRLRALADKLARTRDPATAHESAAQAEGLRRLAMRTAQRIDTEQGPPHAA